MLKIQIQKAGWKANLLLGAFSLASFFSVMELALYFSGFNYSQFPKFMNIKMVGNYIHWQKSQITAQQFIPHKKRMWAAKPEFGDVNENGYIGRSISVERNPGLKRILFLGDSCTAGMGYYPDRIIKLFREQYGAEVESLIAAVGGYSTYQGLEFMKESLKYKPDILVSYFGWNDHWLAIGGLPDNLFKELTESQIFIHNTFSKLRTYQLLHFMIYPPKKYSLGNNASSKISSEEISQLTRVPENFYIYNVKEMIKVAAENNIKIYFIAPPMGLHITEISKDFLIPTHLIPQIHNYYLGILKQVVAEYPAAHLLNFEDVVFDKTLMMADGIHLTAKGHTLIAERVVKNLIAAQGLEFQVQQSAITGDG